jgi:translation initiation factor 4E
VRTQFDDEPGGPEADGWPEICGASISVRLNEDIISLWNRHDNPRTRERIRDTARRVLGLPAATTMEYKTNNGAPCLASLCAC